VSWRRYRLGPDFARLLAASATTNLGDGVRLAAGPLLVASLTEDPLRVAAAVLVQQLPWLLFSLPAGAWIDRLDRRRVVMAVGLARAVLAALLAAAIATDALGLVWLYAVLFAVGIAEVVADNATSALVPALVADEHLPRANARLTAAFMVGNQFAGPPLGAWLFVAGAAWPFGAEAVAFAAAALLVAGMRRRPAPELPAARTRGWPRRDITEGLRWLWGQDAVRLLAVVLAVMNVTFFIAFAVWVLYARQRLGVSETGFGVLLTATAAGGLAGASLVGRLTDRFAPAALLRAGLVIETGVLAVLAATSSPWVAGAAMVAFGAHATLWGVVATTVRQRLVPDRLRGRVGSVYLLLVMGGAALGAPIGGVLARELGLAGPFWVAAAADVILLAAVWSRITQARLEHPAALETPS
jgi:MFS family permease